MLNNIHPTKRDVNFSNDKDRLDEKSRYITLMADDGDKKVNWRMKGVTCHRHEVRVALDKTIDHPTWPQPSCPNGVLWDSQDGIVFRRFETTWEETEGTTRRRLWQARSLLNGSEQKTSIHLDGFLGIELILSYSDLPSRTRRLTKESRWAQQRVPPTRWFLWLPWPLLWLPPV